MAIKRVANAGGNWNVAATWVPSGVPVAADQVIFSTQSGPLTITAAATIEQINFKNYRNTITFNQTLTLTGDLDLGTDSYTMSGTYGIIINDIAGVTSSGRTFSQPLSLRGSSDTITFNDDFILNNNLEFQPTTLLTLNGNKLKVYGDIIHRNTANVTGTTTIEALGSGEWRHISTGDLRNSLTLNPSGVFSIRGEIHYNQGTLRYISGDVRTIEGNTYSTIYIDRATTLDTGELRWYNINVESSPVIDLATNLYVTGTLSFIHSAAVRGTGSMLFTDSTLQTVGSLLMYSRVAAMTFTFSKSATVSSCVVGGSYNLTLRNGNIAVTKDLYFMKNDETFDAVPQLIQRTISGNSSFVMVGTGQLVTETGSSDTTDAMSDMSITINTTGTVSIPNINGVTYSGPMPAGAPRDRFSFRYNSFVVGTNCTFSLVSGSFLPEGALTFYSSSSRAIGFGNVTFSTVNFSSSSSPNNVTLSLPSNITCSTFSSDSHTQRSDDAGKIVTLLSNTYSIYATNLKINGTVSGTAPLRISGDGRAVPLSASWTIRPDIGDYYPKVIELPFYQDSGILRLTTDCPGLMFRNTNVIINGQGFTYSGSTSYTTSFVTWFLGTCTFSNLSNATFNRLGGLSIGNNPTRIVLTHTTSINDYFICHSEQYNLSSDARFNLATVSIINSEYLDIKDSGVFRLHTGNVFFDKGVTFSTIITGPTGYDGRTGYDLSEPGDNLQKMFSNGDINVKTLQLGNNNNSSEENWVETNTNINFIGTGRVTHRQRYTGGFPSPYRRVFLYSNVNFMGTNTTYGDFRWGSPSASNLKTIRYIAGSVTPEYRTASIIMGGYGGRLDIGTYSFNNIQFGDLIQREHNSRFITRRNFILENGVKANKIILNGTNSFTMSGYTFSCVDFQTQGPGDMNLYGGIYCRDYIIDEVEIGNLPRYTNIFNGGITVSRNLFVTASSDHIITGTGSINLAGTGTWSHRLAGSEIEIDMNINTDGQIRLSGNLYFQNATFTYIKGGVTASFSNLYVYQPTTFDTNGMTWSYVYFNGTQSVNFVNFRSKFAAAGLYFTGSSTFQFLGTGGFSIGHFHGNPGTVSTTLLQPPATYSVRSSLDLGDLSSSSNRYVINSTSSTQSVIFVLEQGASQDLQYTNATRVNSSGGQTIWSYKGTLTTTTNWNNLPTQPRTVSSSSAN